MTESIASRELARPCPWHESVYRALCRRIGVNLPHALLLTGSAGIGKRRFADAFTAALFCRVQVEGIACGACRDCQLLLAGTHPDRHVLVPEALRSVRDGGEREGDSEAEAGSRRRRGAKPSREIRVDDVRALIDFARLSPQRGGHRVALVDPAQAMNVNAANALLKTLEEPGENLVLLLLSDAPARLPPTIRSRCQRIALPEPDPAVALEWLSERLPAGESAAALLAAGRTPLRALMLAGGSWAGQRRTLAKLLVDALTGQGPALRFAEVAAKATSVSDAAAEATEPLLLDWLPTFVSDAVRLAAGVPVASLGNADLATELGRLVEARATQPLFLLGDDLLRLRQQLQAGAGLNRQLLWEEVLLRWSPRPVPAPSRR